MADLLADDDRARRRRKSIVLVLLALAVLLLIVTVNWWRSLPNDDETILGEGSVAPAVLTGAELLAAYQDDPTLTDFASGPLLVKAPLETTPDTGTTVLLRTADPLLDIAARISPTDATRLTDVEEGSEVTLQCERVVPGLRAPTLEGCVIARM